MRSSWSCDRRRQSPAIETALDILRQMPPGTAVYAREHVDAGTWEGTARMARTGVIEQNGILLIPVLLRIGATPPKAVFETWINAYQARAKGSTGPSLPRRTPTPDPPLPPYPSPFPGPPLPEPTPTPEPTTTARSVAVSWPPSMIVPTQFSGPLPFSTSTVSNLDQR
jgi:hypothetical protein